MALINNQADNLLVGTDACTGSPPSQMDQTDMASAIITSTINLHAAGTIGDSMH